ncbi:transposase [Deinococcus sp.]|uniref:transposase n=1 Tax=Deinococcus sp. TaxID=47478 RepID=UPI002869B85B|nr:transposase [Deinococcus sp.]
MVPSATVNVGGLSDFVQPYRALFRDRRLFTAFQAALSGILASGTTCLAQMARVAPGTGAYPQAERRLRRLLHHDHQRSDLSADTLLDQIQAHGAARVAGSDEVVVILDGSDLRKPHSQTLEYLDTVRDLKGQPVAGYRTLNAIGLTPDGRQTLLYHTLYSALAPGFTSENTMVLQALAQITRVLRSAGVLRIIFVLDRGFDSLRILRRLRRLHVDFVIRARHLDRQTRPCPTGEGEPLHGALHRAPVSHVFELARPVKQGKRLIWRPTRTELRAQAVWLDEGRLPVQAVHLSFPTHPKEDQEGWVLLTSLPVSPGVDAGQVVRLYLRRWSIEDVFSWTKTALGWEDVRLHDLQALRTLVAMSWVVASYVFTLGETLNTPEVRLLAHLGGHVPHKNRSPGKKTLLLGLQRLAAAYLIAQTARHWDENVSGDDVLGGILGRH